MKKWLFAIGGVVLLVLAVVLIVIFAESAPGGTVTVECKRVQPSAALKERNIARLGSPKYKRVEPS